MIELVVDNRVRLVAGAALEALKTRGAFVELIDEHEHVNPEFAKAKHFGFKKRIPRKIVTWREDEDGVSFPRGSVPKVREMLRRELCAGDSKTHDRRTLGDPTLGNIPKHRPPSGSLWPHQEMLISRAAAAQNALVRSGAGSGKTTALLALASRLNLPTLVVVPNQNLFDQWVGRCEKELNVPRSWVGQIQGSKRKLGPITIGMQQTLCGCAAEIAPAFGAVFVDEVQRAAARTFLEVVDAFTSKYRVGVSDDERRSDGKEFLIHDMFGPVVGEASHDDLVAQGYVMDVRVRVVPTEFRADWYTGLSDPKKLLAYDHLLQELAGDVFRNALVLREVPAALAFGHQIVVFSSRIDHAMTLDRECNATGVRSGFVIGEHPVESRETLARFAQGTTNAIFGTYQALGTGVDMPMVARGVFAMPIANNAKGRSQFKQYRGRFTRVADGKGAPEVVYLWDRHVFGARALRHLCRWANDVKVEWRGALVPGRQVLKEIEHDET